MQLRDIFNGKIGGIKRDIIATDNENHRCDEMVEFAVQLKLGDLKYQKKVLTFLRPLGPRDVTIPDVPYLILKIRNAIDVAVKECSGHLTAGNKVALDNQIQQLLVDHSKMHCTVLTRNQVGVLYAKHKEDPVLQRFDFTPKSFDGKRKKLAFVLGLEGCPDIEDCIIPNGTNGYRIYGMPPVFKIPLDQMSASTQPTDSEPSAQAAAGANPDADTEEPLASSARKVGWKRPQQSPAYVSATNTASRLPDPLALKSPFAPYESYNPANGLPASLPTRSPFAPYPTTHTSADMSNTAPRSAGRKKPQQLANRSNTAPRSAGRKKPPAAC